MGDDAVSQVIRDLGQSAREESAAILAYTPREAFARFHGMGDVASTYSHVIGEEKEHRKEFTEVPATVAGQPEPALCREPSMLYEPSPHCERVLEQPVACSSFGGVRSWIMCEAWRRMRETGDKTLRVGEAWKAVRKVCIKT